MRKLLFICSLLVSLTCTAQRVNRDTLVINDTSIHFITIGAQTFEIKRTISLEPARLPFTSGIWLGNGGWSTNPYILNNGITQALVPFKKDN